MNRTITQTTLIFGLTALATPAFADANSLITLGLGTGFGFTQASDYQATASNSAVSAELNARLKLLHVLGAELAFTPGRSGSVDGDLVFDSTYRLSGLLYLVPLDVFGLYAKAGVGAKNIQDVASALKEGNSYHAGGGFEVYLFDHFAVGAEFLVLLPGVMSVEKALVRRALTQQQSDTAPNDASNSDPFSDFSVGDVISPRNFRASLSFRYYF